jgi:hypothetical protein
MRLSEEQRIFTRDISKLITFAYDNGIELTFGEAYRTQYQQKEYMRTGLSKTMNSKHLNRLAVDFNFFVNGALTYDANIIQLLGNYWESLDVKNSWGGNWKWKDTPHFQRSV